MGDSQWPVFATAEREDSAQPQIGYVNGLAVFGPNMGSLIQVEVSAIPAEHGRAG